VHCGICNMTVFPLPITIYTVHIFCISYLYTVYRIYILYTVYRISYICRVGQNCIYTYIYTVYLVISKPKIPYVHRIFMVLANPINMYTVFWPTLAMYHMAICTQAQHHVIIELPTGMVSST